MTALFWDVRTLSGYTFTTREAAAEGGGGKFYRLPNFTGCLWLRTLAELTIVWTTLHSVLGVPDVPGSTAEGGRGGGEGRHHESGVSNAGEKIKRTVRSTGPCSRAGTPCTGSRRSQGSRRSGRTCKTRGRLTGRGGGLKPGPVRGQSSLVVRVGVRAGAGLAVLRGSHRGVAEEPGSTLLTQLPLSVVQAALRGGTRQVSGRRRRLGPGETRPAFLPCRCQFPGGRSPSGRYTRTARSVPGTNLHLCGCIRGHSPGRRPR